MPLTIRTNHQWRPFVYRYDVPSEVLASEFDYHGEDTVDGYFRYRGVWYHLDQFMRSEAVPGWHGFHGNLAFSGVAVRVSDDGESYQIATVYC